MRSVSLQTKKREYGDKLQANFHFFTEPIETAQKILDLGFTVSFTGVITFVKQYAEVVSYVPLEKMMSETDAPYVARCLTAESVMNQLL